MLLRLAARSAAIASRKFLMRRWLGFGVFMPSFRRLGESDRLRHFAWLHFDESDQRNHAAIDQRGEQSDDEEEAKQARQECLQVDLTLCATQLMGRFSSPSPTRGEGTSAPHQSG